MKNPLRRKVKMGTKRFVSILGVLLFANQVFGGITVRCTNPADTNQVVVSYQMDVGDANRPRAFGLDFGVSGSATIGSIYGFDLNFYVSPGTYDYNETTSHVDSWGNPVVDETPKSFTIEMCSLWSPDDVNHPSEPPESGELFRFTVDMSCTVSVAENAARTGGDTNGVIMQDTDKSFPKSYVKLIGCNVATEAECYADRPDYAAWVSYGRPVCWCYQRQCHGDSDNRSQGKGVTYWCSTWDLSVLAAAWNKQYSELVEPNGANKKISVGSPALDVELVCADFDHKVQGKGVSYLVSTWDLGILVANWNQNNKPDPNCLPGNRP